MRILFVESDPAVREGFKGCLKAGSAQHEIHFADSGPVALQTLSSKSFDLIITSGPLFLQSVKSRFPSLKRVLVTASSESTGYI